MNVRNAIVTDKGESKMVSEQYIVAAVDFADAERVVRSDATGTGDLKFLRIIRAKVAEVLDGTSEVFWSIKIRITMLKETVKEESITLTYLVRADSLEQAQYAFNKFMAGSVSDWQYLSVSETKIVDYLGN